MSDDKLRNPTLNEAEEIAKILSGSPEALVAFVGADGIREGLKAEKRGSITTNELQAYPPMPPAPDLSTAVAAFELAVAEDNLPSAVQHTFQILEFIKPLCEIAEKAEECVAAWDKYGLFSEKHPELAPSPDTNLGRAEEATKRLKAAFEERK